ncbi:hypothetical protein M5689_013078 [Euphorbia peplus]|nr:hypothetical protein M5689_013078 [Euphorbia peplus]
MSILWNYSGPLRLSWRPSMNFGDHDCYCCGGGDSSGDRGGAPTYSAPRFVNGAQLQYNTMLMYHLSKRTETIYSGFLHGQ